MKKVMEWNPEYVKHLAGKMEDLMKDGFYYQPDDFLNEDNETFNMREDEATEWALQEVLEAEELGGVVDSIDFQDLLDITGQYVAKTINEIEQDFLEQLEEVKELLGDPYKYNGVRKSDFI